jgi:MFS family permease
MLLLVSAALLPGMSAWFAAAAVGPGIQVSWGLTAVEVGWLTTVVQIGFVVGTGCAALLNLADLLPSRLYFPVSALLASGANAILLLEPGYGVALGARFATGFFLAGVYPPAMKMIATWFRSARGLAIGSVVGALTVGKASPYLLAVFGNARAGVVISGASLAGAASALIVAVGYRDGPFRFRPRPFSLRLVGEILRDRKTMLATGGYLGHMWELYAGWLLAAPFFLAFFSARGAEDAEALSSLWGFLVIASGGLGAALAGSWADAWGRERVANGAMLISGGCSLALGWLLHAPLWIVGPVAILWGATIVADSAQFSALVTEVTPGHAVGTALTLQTMMGFALSGVSMQLGLRVVESVGWGPGLGLLALGPVAGIGAMKRLRKIRNGGGTAP